MVKAMALLPLIFLPISIGGIVIFWVIFGHLGGCFGGYLFDCEGHGAIAHINRRYVVCFWANFWTFGGRFFGIFVGN